jgi:hypothetical protein
MVTIVQSVITGCGGSYGGSRNVESDNTCGLSAAAPFFNQVNVNPVLGALALGPGDALRTIAPLDGSPVLDSVPAGACALGIDERGVQRPQGAGCEAGAFERRVPVTPGPSGGGTGNTAPPGGKRCKKKARRKGVTAKKKKCRKRRRK